MSVPLQSARVGHGVDDLVAFGMGALTLCVLILTAPQIGYARDEGFYFQAARQYGQWLDVLWADPTQAVRRNVVDAHFALNAEHPSFMKLLFALSEQLLHRKYQWIATPGLAYRIPGMLMAALATSLTVGFTARLLSRSAAVVAGVLLLAMPRWFHHAHLACFDVPIAALLLLCTLSYRHAIATKRLLPAIVLGVFYGLALDTKHNAWWLPAVFVLHLAITEGRALLAASAKDRWLALRPIVYMLVLGSAVLVLLWPWLWYDTFERLRSWVEFHLRHEYYNMEFLGQTYHRPPMPRAYAWVMTIATVPTTTLLLAAVGIGVSVRHAILSQHGSRSHEPVKVLPAQKSQGAKSVAPTGATLGEKLPVAKSRVPVPAWDERRSTDLLLVLSILSAYAPWWSTSTPIFGGTKHWLAAYPFLCVFAARGYVLWRAKLRERWGVPRAGVRSRLPLVQCGLAIALLAPSVAITANSVPWGLSAYTPIVGGAPGAANLGLNRTFWGYTTLVMFDAMRELAPYGAKVFVHDTSLQSYQMHQADGAIEQKYLPTLNIAQSSLALYHHEPHMQRVEYQIWEAYGTTAPEAVACFDGVPVVWLYARP